MTVTETRTPWWHTAPFWTFWDANRASLLGRDTIVPLHPRDAGPDRALFIELGDRAELALRIENAHSGARAGFCAGHCIEGRLIAATRTPCLVADAGEHYYPDRYRRLVITDEALARDFLADKAERWHEFVGMADGYVTYRRNSRFMPLLLEVADANGIDTGGSRVYGLIHVVCPWDDDTGKPQIAHIGSLSFADGTATLGG